MYVDVLVELKAKKLDKTFTYNVPSDMTSMVSVGKRVLVPFGRQKLEGFIIGINNNDSFGVVDKNVPGNLGWGSIIVFDLPFAPIPRPPRRLSRLPFPPRRLLLLKFGLRFSRP